MWSICLTCHVRPTRAGITMGLSTLPNQDRVKIWAICDPVEGRAQAAVEKFGGKHVHFTSEGPSTAKML